MFKVGALVQVTDRSRSTYQIVGPYRDRDPFHWQLKLVRQGGLDPEDIERYEAEMIVISANVVETDEIADFFVA